MKEMPNTEPLRLYLESIDAYKSGNKKLALQRLCESVGTDRPTPIMEQALAELTQANQAILALILHRSKS